MRLTFLAGLGLSLISSIGMAEAPKNAVSKVCEVSREQLMANLSKGLDLNRDYELAVKESDNTRRLSLLPELEKYDEEIAYPCLQAAREALAVKPDFELLLLFMKYVVSDAISADMAGSTEMARVFIAQPDAVDQALGRLSSDERKLLFRRIGSGLQMGLMLTSATRRELLSQLDLLVAKHD